MSLIGALSSQEGETGVTVTLHYVIEDGTAILGEDYGPYETDT